jgi:cobalt-precorrin-7 (C5)-methyltransferase
MLTEEATRAISRATLIFGSERAIVLARPHIPPECTVKTIDDFKALHTLPDEAVVLSTGDPMLAGLGYLNGDVVPGISSLQVAAARLKIPLARIVAVVAHGTGHEQAMDNAKDEVLQKRIVFLLADPKFDALGLYRRLRLLGIPLNVAVCENLGYPDERITVGSIDTPPFPGKKMYSLMIGEF